MPELLPQNPFCPFSDEYTAYQSCLRLKALGSWGSVAGKEAVMFKFSPEVAARVLGYALILHAPSSTGLVEEICGCADEGEVLVGLAYLYVVCVIGMFKNPKLKGSRSVSMSQPTTTTRWSDAKKLALARDNYRCIFSGNMDIDSFDDGLTTMNEAAGERMRSTVLGHIVFGPSRADYTVGLTDVAQRKLAWATSPAAIIKRLVNVEFESESDIHRAENTFTVTPDFHHAFDEFWVSLRPIEDENDTTNTYEIRTHPPNRNTSYGLPDQVTLTDTTGGRIPLPNRRYFQLHDACARVLYLSGAEEVVERMFRDVRVLAEDGGDDHVLCLALAESLSGS